MVLFFVVCGWREEALAGVFLRTYLVHSTYFFFCTRATKDGKIVNPAVFSRNNTYSSPFFVSLTKRRKYILYPGGDHLGIACIFHNGKKLKKGERSHLLIGGQKVKPFFLTFFGSPACLSRV